MDKQQLRLNEALAKLDVFYEELGNIRNTIYRVQAQLDGWCQLIDETRETYKDMLSRWEDEDDDIQEP